MLTIHKEFMTRFSVWTVASKFYFVVFLLSVVCLANVEEPQWLSPLPPSQFATSPTLFVNTTGGLYEMKLQGYGTQGSHCKPYFKASQLEGFPCKNLKRWCYLERYDWCRTFYNQKRIPWKPIFRGNVSCPVDNQGRECMGVGVCNYDFGICECPAGWRGTGCEIRVRQRCINGLGSISGNSLGIENHNLEDLNGIQLDPENATQWIQFVVDRGSWAASRCAGYCDDVTGLCYCGLGPNRYKKPPPGSPPDAVGSGRLLGHGCSAMSNSEGKPNGWGTKPWDWIYGPRGYCMLPSDSTEVDPKTKELMAHGCGCDAGGYHGPFCEGKGATFCVNNCNGHGWCDRGFCKCLQGWYGSDCARKRLGMDLSDDAVRSHLEANAWQSSGYIRTQAWGPWTEDMPHPRVEQRGETRETGNGGDGEEEEGEEEEGKEGQEGGKEEGKEEEKGGEKKGEKKERINLSSHAASQSIDTQNSISDLLQGTKDTKIHQIDRRENKDVKKRAGRLRPLIYVYDLAEFSSQILQYSHAAGICSWRFMDAAAKVSAWSNTLYDTETFFHEMLLSSRHRTFDPDEADFFYVPMYECCFLYPVANWGERPFFAATATGNRVYQATHMYQAVLRRLKQDFPFWNRTQGADHIFLTFHDEGACYLPEEIYRNSVVLTSWGRMDLDHKSNTAYAADNYSDTNPELDHVAWRKVMARHPCYNPVKDLVLPSHKNPSLYAYSALNGFPPMKRDILLYAKGNMGVYRLPQYSRGLRLKLLTLSIKHQWDKKFSIYVMERAKIKDYEKDTLDNPYSHQLARSKFCAVLPGDGFSARFEDAVLHGCIPVIIQDHVHVSFESILDIDSFSIRIPQSAVNEYLPYILLGISDEQIERMQRKLGSIQHRFVYGRGPMFRESRAEIRRRIKDWLTKDQAHLAPRKDYAPYGHPYDPVVQFPYKYDAFHTVLQWLRWRREQLEFEEKLPMLHGHHDNE